MTTFLTAGDEIFVHTNSGAYFCTFANHKSDGFIEVTGVSRYHQFMVQNPQNPQETRILHELRPVGVNPGVSSRVYLKPTLITRVQDMDADGRKRFEEMRTSFRAQSSGLALPGQGGNNQH